MIRNERGCGRGWQQEDGGLSCPAPPEGSLGRRTQDIAPAPTTQAQGLPLSCAGHSSSTQTAVLWTPGHRRGRAALRSSSLET